jgi:hypothetical protein
MKNWNNFEGISSCFDYLWRGEGFVAGYSAVPILPDNLQTAKNMWNVYDLINQQFLAIQGFFTRVHLNLESHDIPHGLRLILVNIMVSILKICGIATGYARGNSFRRSLYNPDTSAENNSFREHFKIAWP